MTGKKSISIKHFLRISLAVMLLFLFIISALYSLFIYTSSKEMIPINYLNWSIAFLYIILCFQVTFLMSTH